MEQTKDSTMIDPVHDMMGKWDYSKIIDPTFFGANESFELSYQMGMHFLKDCVTVEDWGCGSCYAKKYRVGKYKGIDGSPSKWTNTVCDLRYYKSKPDGIFMRHVLEHNLDWDKVLSNAIDSFKKRFSIIFQV